MIWLILMLNILQVGLHDDTYLPLRYGGLWNTVTDEAAYGGTYQTTSDGTLTFQLQGSGFALYVMRMPSGGDGELCVDDVCTTLSWNAAVPYRHEIIQATGLDGTTTVTLTAVGSISMDAIYIYPEALPTPSPEATPEPLPEYIDVQEDGSQFENRMDSGQRTIIALNAMIVVIVLFGVGYLVVWHDN